MAAIEFVVPIRTESEANKREHFAAKARRVKEQRAAVTAAVFDAGATVYVEVVKTKTGKTKMVARWGAPASSDSLPPPALPCVVTMTRIAPRELDSDNLTRSNKAVRDQLAELLGVDDRDSRISWRCEQERGDAREYSLRIRLEPAVIA